MLDGKQVFPGIVCTNIAKVTGDVTLQVRLRIHPVVVEMLKHVEAMERASVRVIDSLDRMADSVA